MTETRARRKRPARAAGSRRASDDDIRIGPILPVPGLLREFGIEPAGLLARAGLHEQQFDDAENRISFDALGHLLEACIAATQCPHFGLLVGQRFSPPALGVNFYLMRNAPTLREALQGLELHSHLHDRGAVMYLIQESSQEAGFGYGLYHSGRFDAAPVQDAALAIGLSLLRRICGPDWRPLRISFPHSRPADVAPYRRCFGVPLRFDADHAALFFPSRWLDEPINGRDPALQAVLMRLVKEREALESRPLSEGVRRALRTMVVAGTASADQVARLFAQNRRSLHRRLQAEGTNLHTLVNEARCEVSRQLLKGSNRPISEIAALLNYSDATAFSRAFSGWTGVSPREWRSSQNGRGTTTRRLR